MSVIYTTDPQTPPTAPTSDTVAPFVPAYARSKARRGKGGVKTWMILAPIAAVTLGGLGALALFNSEPAQVAGPELAPVSPAALSEPAIAPPGPAAAPAPIEAAAPAPAARQAAPARRTTTQAAPRAARPVVEVEPVLTGPQPYNAVTATSPTSPTATLNRAPVTVTPTPAAPAPTSAPVVVTPPVG